MAGAGTAASMEYGKIYLMGISQGGMIAQHFAIAHPDIVEKLVLGVTASKQNEILKSAVTRWMEVAARAITGR